MRLFLGASSRAFLLIIELVLEPNSGKVPVKLLLVFRSHFTGQDLLIVDGSFCLLPALLDASLHPVSVVTCWFQISILELLLYVSPDLTIFQIWVQLDDLNLLLLKWGQLVEVKATSVESSENDCPDVV